MSGEEILAAFPPRPTQGLNVALAMHALVHADAVCFDVDSTVIAEEGIDVLAAFLGKGEQVSALTRAAMEGGMPFQDALAARLDLLQPSRRQIERCLQEHPFSLTPGVERLVQALHQTGKAVHLVSGGFRIMIEPIAQKLNINPVTHVVANQIVFDSDDLYAGFDTKEPTSQDMGKPRALSHIQQSHHYKTMLMIGDGATDAQAKPPAAAFVGFGGVVVRPSVQAQADWFVTDFDDMTYLLETFCK